jgi:hypothetical protein
LYSGKALDFDGVNDVVNVTTNDLDFGANDFSVSAIVRFDGSISEAKIAYLDKGSTLAAWQIRINPTSNRLAFQANTSSGWSEVNFDDAALEIQNDLTHLTFVRVGSSVTLYINGALYGSGTGLAETLDASNGAFAIGNRIGSSEYWNGLITQYKIFSGALTAAQVADLYLNPEKIVPDGVADSALKLWLPMMEGAGTTAYDGSGNGNHGTISGATWVSGIGAPVAQTALVSWNKGTNLVTYSEQIDNTSWAKLAATALANDTTSPDGYTNADKIRPTSGQTFSISGGDGYTIGAASYVRSSSLTLTAASYTFSAFVKKGEYDQIQLRSGTNIDTTSSGTGTRANLNNGTIISSSGTASSIEDYGNGWYRVSHTFTATAATWYINFWFWNTTSVTSNGTDGVYIWGASITQSSSVQPYIPTLATTQTSPVLLPQGLTANKDITGVNAFESARNPYALNLDGASWAEVHDNASLDFGTGAFTMEVWAKVKYVAQGSSINAILTLGGDAWATYYCSLSLRSDLYALFLYSGTVNVSASQFTEGEWAHIVGVYNETNAIVFINGVQEGSVVRIATNISNDYVKMIGKDINATRYYNDQIALPRIYNRALTATEVARNYNADKSKFGL